MADSVYEGMFLLDSNRYGRDPEGVSGQVPAMIQEAGGEVLVSRLWEERRLAYPIRGRRKGTYWLTYFRIGGQKLVELNRRSQLNDNVLRALFIKIDPRIVDTLVEHAQAGTVKPASDRIASRSVGPGGVKREAGKGKAEAGKGKAEAGKGKTEAGKGKTEAGEEKAEAGEEKAEAGKKKAEAGEKEEATSQRQDDAPAEPEAKSQ